MTPETLHEILRREGTTVRRATTYNSSELLTHPEILAAAARAQAALSDALARNTAFDHGRTFFRAPKVYIAGRMSGLPLCNFPAFYDAETYLWERDYNPINPARATKYLIEDEDKDEPQYDDYLAHAATQVLNFADAILFLDGWNLSAGARLECAAGAALKLPMFEGYRNFELGNYFTGYDSINPKRLIQ